MSKTIKIARAEDIQPGDHVTLVWNGDDDTTVSGIVRTAVDDRARYLGVAGLPFCLGDGTRDWRVAVATREVPDASALPTEPGSVIVNATIRGETGLTAFLDEDGAWFTLRSLGEGFYFHLPEHITYWEPARIVPEGGAS